MGIRLRVMLAVLCSVVSPAVAADLDFLRQSVSQITETPADLTAEGIHFRPVFGVGDPNSRLTKGLIRFGEVTVDPGGASKTTTYPHEEQIYYIVEGTGLLHYGRDRVPIARDDFMYLPVGIEHGVSNPRERPLRVMVMGFLVPDGGPVPPTPRPMLANATDVPLQVLGQHGPTTQFRLLMGPTRSQRDRLAATQLVSSLFLMDFAPGGTNIPHRHPREEEIYYVLRGHGDMVAGSDPNGREIRHPTKEGDAFFFPPGTLIGYYSGAVPGAEHDLILAVRSNLPPSERKE